MDGDEPGESAPPVEAALQENEARARALTEHAAGLLLEIDERGRTLYAGAGCIDVLGYTPEELLRTPLMDLIHPDDRDGVIAQYCRAEEIGTALVEHRGRHKNGSWRWLEDTVRAYRTHSGERRFAVIGRDVTSEKELEDALARQAVVQHEIAELSRHFLALDPGQIDADVQSNLELAARLARAERTQLIILEPDGSAIRAAYAWTAPGVAAYGPQTDPETLKRFRWAVRTLDGGETINAPSPDALPAEAAAEAEDMRRRGVEGLLAIPVRVGDTLIGFQVFETIESRPAWSSQELAELRLVGEIFASAIQRRYAAEELERRWLSQAQVADLSRRFLGLEPDQIDDAVEQALEESAALAAAQRAVLFCASPLLGPGRDFYEWCDVGIAPSEPRRMRWAEPRFRAGEPVQIADPAELPSAAEAERRQLTERGVRSVLGIPVLMGDESAGFLAFECMDRHRTWSEHDVTVLRMIGELFTATLRRRHGEAALSESRSQLLQVQKLEAVGRLAGGIAHDFNNLLTVILGFSRPLMGQLEPGAVRDDVQEIQAAAERAAALTKQLLTFSRRQQVATQRVDVNETIATLEGLLRPLLGEDVALLFELEPNVGWVQIDPHQLEQVVMNLAVNARDAMADGGTLRLATRTQHVGPAEAQSLGLAGAGAHVILAACDTGSGMDEETRAHLFDPFYTTKDPSKGTGLGLSIVYGVVEQAGGAIAVSGAAAKGTTFEIYLPRIESGEAQAAEAAPAAIPVTEAHVLVVDDEASVRRVARRLLERAGHRVSEAADGQEALHLCTKTSEPPDLVLTDCVMPRLGGEELALRLRWLCPGTRVLFMSGYPLEQACKIDEPPPSSFLHKPFAPGELVAHVAEALAED
jgi:PAS domain S-box-containing protein